MVFGVISLAATVPLLATSTMQLQNESNKTKDNHEAELKTQKCLLKARASPRMSQRRHDQLRDMIVVVRDGALFLEKAESTNTHPFMGYLLPFPETQYDGMVTTINSENFLNWVYVDRDTYQMKHGTRAESQGQLRGPVTLQSGNVAGEWRICYFGWEGWVAVEDENEQWPVYFDKDDNGLKDKAEGKPVVEIELVRIPLDDIASASSSASMSSGNQQ